MSQPTLHFHTYKTSIRYHIKRVLESKGWSVGEKNSALFSDLNLTLDDEVSKHFEYKHFLAELLQKKCPDLQPLTYPINDENATQVLSKIALNHYYIDHQYQKNIPGLKWILKPSMLNNGDDIKLFNNIEELKKHFKSTDRLGGDQVIQHYVAHPALYQGRKFTYRFLALFTNYDGIYLYRQGYVNISAHPFQLEDNFVNRKVHITNYVLDGELAHITQKLASDMPHFDTLFNQVLEKVKACAQALIQKFPSYLKPQDPKQLEFFGFDFILDEAGKLWLLEINQSPDCPVDPDVNLMAPLWYPYWEAVVGDFVLPMTLGTVPQYHHKDFKQILPPRACYSRSKAWLRKFFG